MAYPVEPSLWKDEKFRLLTLGGKVLFNALLTGPQRQRLPGLQSADASILASVVSAKVEDVETWLGELSLCGMIYVDDRYGVIRVPNAPKYTTCPNPPVLWSWWVQWREFPDRTPLKWDHLRTLWHAVPRKTPSLVAAWSASFGLILEELEAGASIEQLSRIAKDIRSDDAVPRKKGRGASKGGKRGRSKGQHDEVDGQPELTVSVDGHRDRQLDSQPLRGVDGQLGDREKLTVNSNVRPSTSEPSSVDSEREGSPGRRSQLTDRSGSGSGSGSRSALSLEEREGGAGGREVTAGATDPEGDSDADGGRGGTRAETAAASGGSSRKTGDSASGPERGGTGPVARPVPAARRWKPPY